MSVHDSKSDPTKEELRDFYHRYVAAANNRDFDTISSLVNDEVTVNDVPHKREDVVAALKGIADVTPDFTWHIEDLITTGDRIAARLRDTGTPTKEIFGEEPTGASIEITEFAAYRVRDGRFVEMWFLMDVASAVQQLGRK
ncbi:NTF2-like protein [Lophiostoma macrostomum CBS 122681]|uniref:NTF2-like protein n=1 Tax=Lophiostoma macrostomum CBS 122681 TaxID=1314788 RepID=A0A6A6T2P9_9PLEO|nr:NTF2-like protein [Lophiostoma macrostomum CBS 122681]